jgi:hypothetical protein
MTLSNAAFWAAGAWALTVSTTRRSTSRTAWPTPRSILDGAVIVTSPSCRATMSLTRVLATFSIRLSARLILRSRVRAARRAASAACLAGSRRDAT